MAYIAETDELIVAMFGDKRPVTGPEGPQAGRQLVQMQLSKGSIQALTGPALHRPIDIAYQPSDRALYVVDFGEFELGHGGEVQTNGPTGAIWRLQIEVS